MAILVATTIYYTIQNKGMRDEMKKDRELTTDTIQRSVTPHLVVKQLITNAGYGDDESKDCDEVY